MVSFVVRSRATWCDPSSLTGRAAVLSLLVGGCKRRLPLSWQSGGQGLESSQLRGVVCVADSPVVDVKAPLPAARVAGYASTGETRHIPRGRHDSSRQINLNEAQDKNPGRVVPAVLRWRDVDDPRPRGA